MKGTLVSTKTPEGLVVLNIIGDFTNETTPQYQKICNEVIQDHQVKGIILDFNQVATIDTSAFACMINFIKEHAEKNVRIGIIYIKDQHKALLEILKLEKQIFYYGSKEEAISELTKS